MNPDLVKDLINRGFDPDLEDANGVTPRSLAITANGQILEYFRLIPESSYLPSTTPIFDSGFSSLAHSDSETSPIPVLDMIPPLQRQTSERLLSISPMAPSSIPAQLNSVGTPISTLSMSGMSSFPTSPVYSPIPPDGSAPAPLPIDLSSSLTSSAAGLVASGVVACSV